MKREKKLCFRVTDSEKEEIQKRAVAAGYENLSDYMLASCLSADVVNKKSDFNKLDNNELNLISVRVTEDERKAIIRKAELSGCNNLSRYIRNCCMGEVVVLSGLKDFSVVLNRIGTNLNQIARLCNEGLIQCADITETRNVLQEIYKELGKLNKKVRLRR